MTAQEVACKILVKQLRLLESLADDAKGSPLDSLRVSCAMSQIAHGLAAIADEKCTKL